MAKATCARTRTLARSQLCGTHCFVDCAAAKAARPGPGTYELPSAFGSQRLSSRSTSAVRPPLSSPAAAVGIHRSPYVALACCTLCLTPSLGLPLRCVAARPHPAARPCALAYRPYTHAQVYSMGLRPNSRARSDAGPGPAYMLQDSIGAQSLSNRGSAPRWQFGSNARFRSTLTSSCTCTRARGQQCTTHSTQRNTPNTALWHKHSSGSARRCRCGRCRCGRIVFSARHTSSRNERQPLPPAGSARANHSEAMSERWDTLPATAGVDLSGRGGACRSTHPLL